MNPKPALPAPIATIDVGTNTALLLISTWDEGNLVVVHDETKFVRLGAGVDATKIVNNAAMERLRLTLQAYKETAESWNVAEVIIGATSASRDAANKEALVEYVKETTGLQYGILSGLEEAEWSFKGVCAGLDAPVASILTLDIGGGSTELTLGMRTENSYQIGRAQSLDVGSVRLKEKFFQTLPPSRSMVAQAAQWINEQVKDLPAVYENGESKLIGASGTTNVLAILENGLPVPYAPQESSLGSVSINQVNSWYDKLIGLSADEVQALNPEIMKGREDVFAAGILILKTLMEYLGKSAVHVNTWGLRHGLALRHWLNS